MKRVNMMLALALLCAAGYRIEQISLNKDTSDANQTTE